MYNQLPNNSKVTVLEMQSEPSQHSQSEDDSIQITVYAQFPSFIKNCPDSHNFSFRSADVGFPTPNLTGFFTHMIYRISLLWKEEQREVERRFSNIEKLRFVLKNQLQFSLVFPVHYKNFKKQKNGLFLADRTEEINYFFRYIIYHKEKFAVCEKILDVFFDPNLNEKNVNSNLGFFPVLSYAMLLGMYSKIVKDCEFDISSTEKRDKIDKFHTDFQKSMSFYKVDLIELEKHSFKNFET